MMPRREFDRDLVKLHSMIGQLIKEAHADSNEEFRNEMATSLELMKNGQIVESKLKRRLSLLDEIRICENLLVALTETTGIALGACVWLLGQNPIAQEKARQQVDEMFEENESLIDKSMIGGLTYLRWSIKESLRLLPPVLIDGRQVNGSKGLDLGHVWLPDKTYVVLNINGLHRNPHHWTNPDEFCPERFSDEASAMRHPYAYLPFLAGKRSCPGMNKAYTYLTIVLAHLLRNFTWESRESLKDLKFTFGIGFKCDNDLDIRFKGRQ